MPKLSIYHVYVCKSVIHNFDFAKTITAIQSTWCIEPTVYSFPAADYTSVDAISRIRHSHYEHWIWKV